VILQGVPFRFTIHKTVFSGKPEERSAAMRITDVAANAAKPSNWGENHLLRSVVGIRRSVGINECAFDTRSGINRYSGLHVDVELALM
jgi:hypothetical protein